MSQAMRFRRSRVGVPSLLLVSLWCLMFAEKAFIGARPPRSHRELRAAAGVDVMERVDVQSKEELLKEGQFVTVFKFSNISAIPFECFCLGMTRFGIGEDTHKLLRGCFCTTNQASESLQIELEAVESKLRRANAFKLPEATGLRSEAQSLLTRIKEVSDQLSALEVPEPEAPQPEPEEEAATSGTDSGSQKAPLSERLSWEKFEVEGLMLLPLVASLLQARSP
ncbi:unnamed protein product [Durusdinium trenchii]|uniref:Uncharacterized protein n=1 Tax=Durusdinium trenchii TaxID=1381693 RepID=A0ABP0M9C0_9DINO